MEALLTFSDTAVVQSTIRCPGEAQASGDLTKGTSVEKPKKRRISGDRARSEAAATELLGVLDRGGQVVEGGAREGAREGQGHETQVLLRRPGLLNTS